MNSTLNTKTAKSVLNKNTVTRIADSTAITVAWKIVTDSTFKGVGITNNAYDYTGQPGDYFNFTANGLVYTKEGAVLDTFTYHMVADTGIYIAAIVNNSGPQNFRVKNFNTHTLVIATPIFAPPPGGLFGRNVSLAR